MTTPLILITGLPGTGKTTIVKRVIEDLKKMPEIFKIMGGFITEELRDIDGNRSGFDVVTIDGKRAALARSREISKKVPYKHKVGKYSVYLDDFEKIAIPILSSGSVKLFVIDEIGKMELLSDQFHAEISKLKNDVSNGKKYLIATIPTRQRIDLVESLKTINNYKLFEVTKQNRNSIYAEVFDCVSNNMLRKK